MFAHSYLRKIEKSNLTLTTGKESRDLRPMYYTWSKTRMNNVMTFFDFPKFECLRR